MLEYRQNRAVRKRELRKKETDDSVKLNCDSVHEFEGKKNTEKQSPISQLRTPDKEKGEIQGCSKDYSKNKNAERQ